MLREGSGAVPILRLGFQSGVIDTTIDETSPEVSLKCPVRSALTSVRSSSVLLCLSSLSITSSMFSPPSAASEPLLLLPEGRVQFRPHPQRLVPGGRDEVVGTGLPVGADEALRRGFKFDVLGLNLKAFHQI